MRKLSEGLTVIVLAALVGVGCGRRPDRVAPPGHEGAGADAPEVAGAEGEAAKPPFPTKALPEVADVLSKGGPVLTKQDLLNWKAGMKALDELEGDEIEAALKKLGYAGVNDFLGKMGRAQAPFLVIKGLVAVEALDSDPVAGVLGGQTRKMSLSMTKTLIEMNKLTRKDLELAYDNWDIYADTMGD